MSVLKPRNRLVYFRVSEDEYRRFNHICESIGARSISDLARSAVQNMMQEDTDSHSDRFSDRLTVIEAMINELNQRVHQLTVFLGKSVFMPPDSLERPEKLELTDENSGGG